MGISKKRKNQNAIMAVLQETYRGIGPALKFDSVYQLLIAVILSAQTNDNQVNKITAELFKEHGTPEKMAELSEDEIIDYIRTCGLYKNKAKSIYAATRILLNEYGGEVPKDRTLLMQLPGVGRKTANVVLSVGFKEPALAVDTHVFRVAHRMGLSNGKTPDAVERDLCEIIPKEDWADAHHWLIWHGRKACSAKKPLCESCPVDGICPKKI
ncbi:MAG: endonuclease III [Bacillota bacterium]